MIGYFVNHPNASNLLMVAAVIVGLSALPQMERESFPEFVPSKVAVEVVYPGASAADVDEEVCQSLDSALGDITGLTELTCQSVEGRATATLELQEGGDLGQFYNDILSDVSALNDLPDDAEAPTVSIAARTEQIALLAVTGIADEDALKRYADYFEAQLTALPLVADAVVTGISDQEVRVLLDPVSLRRFGLSARDVADALEARSLRQPLGTVATRASEITLRYGDARRDVAELSRLVIRETASGGFVRLSDVATIVRAEAAPELQSFLDGGRAAVLSITKTKDADAIEAFGAVEALIAAETARFPKPFAITVTRNETENIEDRISLIVSNTVIGLVLVLLVMVAYFSLGSAFWIAAALPVTFCAAFFVLSVLGQTINMISLIGLLMAVGLIMDDSIVIADNIARWRKTHPPAEAAVRGTMEVMPGVLASFLTTASVFGPLMFLSGEMGQILKVIPIVLLVTLALSLVEAFLILPNHLSHTASDPEKDAARAAPRATEWVKTRLVLPLVARFVAWRYLTLGLTVSLLVATVGLVAGGHVKVVGFPTIEADTIEARVALTAGTPLPRTARVAEQLTDALARVNAQLSPGTEGGAPLVERVLIRFAANGDVASNGPHTLTVTVDLLKSAVRNVSADDVLDLWRAEAGPITDLSQISFSQSSVGPGGADLDVEVRGRDLGALEAAAATLQRRLLAEPGIREARLDFTRGQTALVLAVNDLGIAAGLSPQALAAQLRGAFSGTETDTFREEFSDGAVRVEVGDFVGSLTALEDFPVMMPGGKQTALSAVARITVEGAFEQITRKEGAAIAKIEGSIDRQALTAGDVARLVTERLGPEVMAEHPGVTIAIGGASQATSETQSSIVTSLLLGLVGVYLILAFLFRSYTLPLVVMLSIPFAVIGMVLGHLALGIDLAMPSFVGFASLAGIVVNNAILFVTFFERGIRDGDVASAAVAAVSDRFRAIVLSFTTTFVGLMPIVLETSPQAQVMVPLVTAVAFGLLSSTLLSIFVLPAALTIYFDYASVTRWAATRDQRSAAPAAA
ncbi:MAG: efflux RND transporter permease subunit [Pseudomonadota bacterium]